MGWCAVNIEESHANDGEVLPLRLRLTHSGGDARDGAILIPATGRGVADALQLCGERQSEAQWRVANLCRIAWIDAAAGWQLRNGSHALMCVRNGERVRVGLAVPIAVGDTLELGLLRFAVESGEGGAVTAGQVPAAPTRPVEHASSAFDLRDLAARGGESGSLDPEADMQADPFGMLGIARAQSRPTADVLSELLGESLRPALRALPWASKAVPASPPSAPDGPVPLLDELHDEFVRVVRDPDQLSGRTDWEGFLAFGGEPAPSLDELSEQAQPYALLRDILQPPEAIDRLIDHFESLVSSGLLDTEQPDDVLSLFAPELARDARTSLPSLTRREHHDLSPDSHIRIGSARASEGDEGEGASR